MDKPPWKETAFEGRLLRMTALGPEEPFVTRIGTRYAVPVRVEILSGLFAGQEYDKVPVFAKLLKEQLSSGEPVEGKLGRGSGKPGAIDAQWMLRVSAG